jgi:hypothetical protein
MYTHRFVKIRILSTERGGGGGWGVEFLLSPSPFTPPPSFFFQILAPWYMMKSVVVCHSMLKCVAVCCRVL